MFLFVDKRYVCFFCLTFHCPPQKLSLQEKKTLTCHHNCFYVGFKYSENTNGKKRKQDKAIPVTGRGGP
jgi:hypothetical protein